MTRAYAAAVLAACLTASTVHAQESRPTVILAPAAVARWDAAAHVTWLGEHRDQSFEWDRWFGVASGGGSVGYYWTSHLKTEIDVSTSSQGELYSVETIPNPGATTPLFLQRDHEFRITTASAGLTGQFFDNAWFHPFVGGGIELVREREHIETVFPIFSSRDPRLPVIAVPADQSRVRYGARPYAAIGFKVYVSERAFIRTDIRTSWSADGLAALGWRSGIGVDF
jgi:hypothetical protein